MLDLVAVLKVTGNVDLNALQNALAVKVKEALDSVGCNGNMVGLEVESPAMFGVSLTHSDDPFLGSVVAANRETFSTLPTDL